MEVYAKYTHKHTGRQCLGAQTPMAAGPGLGKGATVLLKWAAAFWFQPVVLQDVEPVLTDLLIFQKKSKSRLLPKSLGPTRLWGEGLQGHVAKEKRAGKPRGLQAGRQQRHPASPHSAPGPGRQPAVEGVRGGACHSSSLAHEHSQDGAEVYSGPTCPGSDPLVGQVTRCARG